MSKLPNVSLLHRLADVADAETIDTKYKKGLTFGPVTEADPHIQTRG